MTYILHLDTAASLCTVMLSQDGVPVHKETLNNSKEQSSKINGLIDAVLQVSMIRMKDLAAVSICNGPGSYTGLRVGLATAKGICYTLSIPLLLHNKLTLIADENCRSENRAVVLRARDAEAFATIYEEGKESTAPAHFFMQDLEKKLEKISNLQIFTDDNNLFAKSSFTINNIEGDNPFNMKSWAKTAYAMYQSKDFSDLAYAEPYYLKAAFTTQAKK